MAMKPRVFGYSRVSTDDQLESRLSINAQQEQIRKFCRDNALDLGRNDCRMGEESASAFHLPFIDRPLGKALNDNMVEGDHIVIAKVDRAFRNMVDAVKCVEAWQKRGIVVHLLDMPISGMPIFDKLILGILAWCAEFESHRKSERLIEAFRSARRMGRPATLCAPLCFKWHGSTAKRTHKLVYFPEEREHVALAFELYVEQDLSIWEIVSYLMCKKIVPYDKRPADKMATSKRPVSKEYNTDRVRQMIALEAEFRYYEAMGYPPEEAARQWLHHWGHGTLPTRDELQKCVNENFVNVPRMKGEPCHDAVG